MAKFVPNVLTAEVLADLEIPTDKFKADFANILQAALDRLYKFQHEDGGWGWCENDATDPYMTAYTVMGLAEAIRLGYPVDAVRLDRGVDRLRLLAKGEKDLNRLAYQCYALSRGPYFAEVERVVQEKDALSPYALAAATLALHRWGRSEAVALRQALVAKFRDNHWETKNWYYKWEKVDIETTAIAIRALTETDPSNPHLAAAVDWLLSQRKGNQWKSTKDTAAAIYAILKYVRAEGKKLDTLASAVDRKKKEGAPELLKKVRVRVNGAERELLVNLSDPTQSVFECHFDGRELRKGENPIAVEAGDDLEFEIETTLRTTGGKNPPQAGLSIRTEYSRPLSDLRIGDEAVVSVAVRGDADYDFVLAEIPIPAGCEVIRGSGEGGFARFEERYEKALFYLRSVGTEPVVLGFRVRCLFAGRFTVPPPTAAIMYDESIGGRGTSAPAVIRP